MILDIEYITKQNDLLDTPIHTSIKNRNMYSTMVMVYYALEKCPEIFKLKNKQNKTIFDLALENNEYIIVKEITKSYQFMNNLDEDNQTILMKLISQRDDDNICKIINFKNTNIDYTIVGSLGTTLHTAIYYCAYKVIYEILNLTNVEDFINIKNKFNQTPLNTAITDQSYDISLLLIEKGATLVFDDITLNRLYMSDNVKIRNILWPLIYISKNYNISNEIIIKIMKYM